MDRIFCPRHCIDGTKPENYDQKMDEYFAKLKWLKENSVSSKYEMFDFYDYETFVMPDGSIWKRTVSNEYMLEYSIERVA